MSPRARSRALAVLLSFAVYLVPLVGPHAAWSLGEHLLFALRRRGESYPAAWIATDFAAALAAQASFGLILYRALLRPRLLSLLAVLAAVPIGFVLMEWTYLIAIPSHFLIERDAAPERRTWMQHCFLPDVTLATVRAAPDLPLERAGEALVTAPDGRAPALLRNCDERHPIAAGEGTYASSPFVLPDGAMLFGSWDVRAAKTTWLHVASGGSGAVPLARPPRDPDRAGAILSTDGRWTAWIEDEPGATTPPIAQRVLLRALDGSGERAVPLDVAGRASAVLVGADVAAGTLELFEYEYRTRRTGSVVIDLNGRETGRVAAPDDLAPQSTTFVRVGQGFVAWDAYREDGRYRIAWSLAGGNGRAEIPKGRGITAVAVAPDGRHVAVSTTTALNIGSIRDSVFVLRASDSAEVFRAYLPTYARSRVAFLDSARFVYDDRENERFGIRILAVAP